MELLLSDLLSLAKYATPVPIIAALVWALEDVGLPPQWVKMAHVVLGMSLGLLAYFGTMYPEFGRVMAFMLGGLVAGLVAAGAPALIARLRRQ